MDITLKYIQNLGKIKMHEHKVYVYVLDQAYQPSQEQKDKAVSFFELIVPSSHQGTTGLSDYSIELDDGSVIETTFTLRAGGPAGSNKYWLIDEDESADDADEEDYDELDFGTELRPEVIEELESILGTKLALTWEWDD